jgi:peptide chain release factor 1
MNWQEKAQQITSEWEEINNLVASGLDNIPQAEQAGLFKKQKELSRVAAPYQDFLAKTRELAETEKLLTNPEMAELASQEIIVLKEALNSLGGKIEEELLPKDPDDSKPAIVEIRPGTGGDEAGLFVGDLLKMYLKFCESQGLKPHFLTQSESEAGSLREVILKVTGENAYGLLRFESGVHRVQRVPATEAKGRVHTSTATVAVLPEAEETDLEIKKEDLRIDVFRASGNGGQSVNTTDSAVRITHIPTGVVVSMQDEKSQTQNKLKAMEVLRTRLLAHEKEQQTQEASRLRKDQIGSGDRSEKIRTYNYPQNRVTDHRLRLNKNLDQVMEGHLEDFVTNLRKAWQSQMS